MERYASDGDEPLEDSTAALTLRSKRTERMQRKQEMRDRMRSERVNITRLPTELIVQVLESLRPSDVFGFCAANRRFHAIVLTHAPTIGAEIIKRRYGILSRCFPRPVFLADVDGSIQPLLTDTSRQSQLGHYSKPYQHVQPPDPQLLCTCFTCILTWNNLGLVLDFARWQDNLDTGEPIPMVPRGRKLEWNQELIAQNAAIARRALDNTLWYARILEKHLDSTVRSIRRHQKNKGNKRKHVNMTEEEAATGTDHFLDKAGPLSLEFPYHRDEYYLLEAYLPNRWWKKTEQQWVYIIAGLHERDLDLVVRLSKV